MLHKFKTTHKFNDQEYTELDIPIENITTLDYEKAEMQFRSLNPNFAGVIELESGFTKQIMINACKLPAEFFNSLPANEFVKLKMAVQSFLLS